MPVSPETRVKILEDILNNTRNTQPVHVIKGVSLYKEDQENFDIDHLAFLEMLEYMFGPSGGRIVARTFWRRIA